VGGSCRGPEDGINGADCNAGTRRTRARGARGKGRAWRRLQACFSGLTRSDALPAGVPDGAPERVGPAERGRRLDAKKEGRKRAHRGLMLRVDVHVGPRERRPLARVPPRAGQPRERGQGAPAGAQGPRASSGGARGRGRQPRGRRGQRGRPQGEPEEAPERAGGAPERAGRAGKAAPPRRAGAGAAGAGATAAGAGSAPPARRGTRARSHNCHGSCRRSRSGLPPRRRPPRAQQPGAPPPAALPAPPPGSQRRAPKWPPPTTTTTTRRATGTPDRAHGAPARGRQPPSKRDELEGPRSARRGGGATEGALGGLALPPPRGRSRAGGDTVTPRVCRPPASWAAAA